MREIVSRETPRSFTVAKSDGHRTRLLLGKVRRRTSKKSCAFLEVHFYLVSLHAKPKFRLDQRTPWGGGKKRGVENLTNDTPPKKGFWTTLIRYVSTPLRCQCSVFPVQKSTTEQTRSSFGGVQTFSGERVLWYVFLPPYVLHPPISRLNWKLALESSPLNSSHADLAQRSQRTLPY